jgi:hypothetical protein
VLGASVSGAPAHAQTLNRPPVQMLNRPLIRPLTSTPSGTLSPSQQMQTQSFANTLSNRERNDQSLGGATATGATSTLRTEQQLNNVQLQQIERH